MDRYQALAEKFRARDKVIGTTMTILGEPILLEKMVRSELDFILFDSEHGRFEPDSLVPLLHTCRLLGMPSFVRVRDSEYHLIAKCVDMGADGIMLPRTETLEQLRTALDALCFAPVGRKGCGGYAQMRKGETFEQFQKGRYLIPQIESQRGIDMLPEMLETYGEHISGVMVGPYDMSVMLGTPLDVYSPVMHAAIQKVLAISARYGKSSGVFCNDEKDARLYRDMGANLLWTAVDVQFYMKGYTETIDALGAID